MSDAVDDLDFYAEQLLNKSKTNPLREQMREFIAAHGPDDELKQVRAEVADGKTLSDVVIDGRDERL